MLQYLVLAFQILRTTLPHYIPPPSSCLLSQFCNHTWTSECGQERLQKDMRMFLDLCDMHEYNCDEKKDYKVVDIKDCPKDDTTTIEKQTNEHPTDKTVSNSVTTEVTTISTMKNPENASSDTTNSSPTSTTTPTLSKFESTIITSPTTISTTSTEQPSKCNCLTQSSTTKSTLVTFLNNTTEPSIITSPTTISTTSKTTEQPLKCTCLISSTTQSTVVTSLTTDSTVSISSTTSASVTSTLSTKDPNPQSSHVTTTISIAPLYTECTRDAIPSENTVSIQSTDTTATTQSTEKTENTETTNTNTDDETDTTKDNNENTEVTEAETEIEEIEIETETVSTSPLAQTDQSVVTCSSYPGDCDRPNTWETTTYGEKRDFFQILRERFGNKVKILRATTHWPRRVLISNQGNTFYYGRHGDSNVK